MTTKIRPDLHFRDRRRTRRRLRGFGALALSLGLLVAAGAVRAAAEGVEPPAGASAGGVAGWLKTRFTIGGDWSRLALDDTRRVTRHGPDNLNRTGNYLGSLWGLDAEQHAFPDPFVEYRAVASFGLGAAYGQLRARTLDWADDARTVTIGDGDVEIRGLRTYAFGFWRNRTRFTPYGNLGLSRYRSRFLVLPSWTRGEAGRVIQVDGTHDWFFVLGVRARLERHLEGSVFYRRSLIADVGARAYGDIIHLPERYTKGSFPMESRALGIGLAYRF